MKNLHIAYISLLVFVIITSGLYINTQNKQEILSNELEVTKRKLSNAADILSKHQDVGARTQLPPKQAKAYLLQKEHKPKHVPKFDVSKLIRINSVEDIKQKRNSLINFIWKDKGFPSNLLPSKIEEDLKDESYTNHQNIKQLDKLTVSMKHGVESYIYYYHNKTPNKCLAIFHRGHGTDYHYDQVSKPVSEGLLDINCDTMVISMPLLGVNNQPEVFIEGYGKIKLRDHDSLRYLATENFSPISYFMTPITSAINHAQKIKKYKKIIMTGFSGGGWSTVLYAALDERIHKSYSVSGSAPIYLRKSQAETGDYEQATPELYNIANYLELYVMSISNNRRHIQVINRFDSCCFSGTGYKTYINSIAQKSKQLSGKFLVMLDSSVLEHTVSKAALKVILKDIHDN